jgi:hypothetical protein
MNKFGDSMEYTIVSAASDVQVEWIILHTVG